MHLHWQSACNGSNKTQQ